MRQRSGLPPRWAIPILPVLMHFLARNQQLPARNNYKTTSAELPAYALEYLALIRPYPLSLEEGVGG